MAEDDTFAALAADLQNENRSQKHDAAQALKKSSFAADSIGPGTEPRKPKRFIQDNPPTNVAVGDEWVREKDGVQRWWHGTAWRQYAPGSAEDLAAKANPGAAAKPAEPEPADNDAGDNPEVDVNGEIWSADKHSPNKTKNKDGTWRVKTARKMARDPGVTREGAPAEIRVAAESLREVELPGGGKAMVIDDPLSVAVERAEPEPEFAEVDDGDDPEFAEVDDGDDPEVEFMDVAPVSLNPRQFIPSVRDALLEQFKNRPKPWSAMSEAQQRDCAAALDDFAENLVRRIVEEVATGPNQSIRCLLESYTEKDGIKLSMKVQAFGDQDSERAVIFLHKARGKHVMLRLASIEEYKGNAPATIDADQPEIDWDADPVDPHMGDDDDLAEVDLTEDEIAVAEAGPAPTPSVQSAGDEEDDFDEITIDGYGENDLPEEPLGAVDDDDWLDED